MTVEFFLIRCDFVFVLLCKRNFIELALLSCVEKVVESLPCALFGCFG